MRQTAINLLRHHNDIASIIIGENGSGKSYLLNELARDYLSDGHNVIGISNSIHDKFTVKSPNFHFLGARTGRNISKTTIKNAIKNISIEDMVQLKRISQILSYVGYSGEIGIQLRGVKDLDHNKLEEAEFLTADEREIIESLAFKYSYMNGGNSFDEKILWLGFDEFSFDKVNRSIFSRLISLEQKLRKLNILKSINVFLRKGYRAIPLSQASSGELSFITSVIYLSTVITDRTVILIDEPENSLHPSWQKGYLGKILDLFHYYQPTIVIATHSPLIVSGAEKSERFVSVYKSENGVLNKLEHQSDDLETLLWSHFGVTTPENRFMSNFLVSTLNDLWERKIGIDETLSRIAAFENSIYDRKQIYTLAGAREIALKIQARNQ